MQPEMIGGKGIAVLFMFLQFRIGNNQPPPPPGPQCRMMEGNPCACTMSDGSGVIDLTSLGTADGTPRFKDVQQKSGIGSNSFSYSPCNGFTEGQCENAAMCITTSETDTEQIGDGGHTIFIYDGQTKSPIAAYTHRTLHFISVSEVELTCDPNACDPVFSPEGQNQPHYYKFTLTSVCACVGACTSAGPSNCKSKSGSGSISAGSVLLIGFFSVILLYLVTGVLYSKVKRKATGRDLFPNKDLWASLPVLIKTGFRFTFGKCLPKRFQFEKI